MYTLVGHNYTFLKNKSIRRVQNNLLLRGRALSYVATHTRASTTYHACQLVDMLAYELPNQVARSLRNVVGSLTNIYNQTLVVYNFHSIMFQFRLFIFAQNFKHTLLNAASVVYEVIDSISDLFQSANWLERELSELHGVLFNNKKDTRNLMLQYGDSTTPMCKSQPSVGLIEMVYLLVLDTLAQLRLSTS